MRCIVKLKIESGKLKMPYGCFSSLCSEKLKIIEDCLIIDFS
jgi:hypothetical protein